MTEAQPTTGQIKALCAADLDTVIAIDTATSGTSRRGYFEKYLSAATERPKDYVYVGLQDGDDLVGFAFAKLVTGEFGKPGASAVLDAIGVDPAHRGKGAGHQLLNGVVDILFHKGVRDLTSQVDWANPSLLGFLGRAGFALDTRTVLTRSTDKLPVDYPDADDMDDPAEVDHSAVDSDDSFALSNDKVPVRSMRDSDLRSMISIDKRVSGEDRTSYFEHKQFEVLHAAGVRVSLVAELEEYPVGFIMARVDFGEFGHTGKEAVMDTIGVDPGYQGRGVGQALMSQLMDTLSILQVESVRTEVEWDDVAMIDYLSGVGFTPAQQITLCRKLH